MPLTTFLAVGVLAGVALVLIARLLLACAEAGAVVRVSTRLPIPAERAWQLLVRTDTFLYVTRGLVGFPDAATWPARLLTPGLTLTTSVRLFHIGMPMPHRLTVARVDEAAHVVESREQGALVPVWNHRLQIEPLSPAECRYTDRIELQAGRLTPVVWLFAWGFYLYRQMRWRRLVRSRA